MKKTLSLLLVGALMVSSIPAAFATNTYDQDYDGDMGTQVVYDAADPDGDGDANVNNEAYTVTVPAVLAPGDTGHVVVAGTWASNRKLVVGLSSNSVTLVNSINAANTKTLALTFEDIAMTGSNTEAVTNKTAESDGAAITVADISDALFGTWSGTFYYDVEMQDA